MLAILLLKTAKYNGCKILHEKLELEVVIDFDIYFLERKRRNLTKILQEQESKLFEKIYLISQAETFFKK